MADNKVVCIIKVWGRNVDVVRVYRQRGYADLPPTLTLTGVELRHFGAVDGNRTLVRRGDIKPIEDAEAVSVAHGDEFDALPPCTH